MGTTLVAASIQGNTLYVANVGTAVSTGLSAPAFIRLPGSFLRGGDGLAGTDEPRQPGI